MRVFKIIFYCIALSSKLYAQKYRSTHQTYTVDTNQLPFFNWRDIKNTQEYSIRYLQLNFFTFPSIETTHHTILQYEDSINKKTLLLTTKQQYQLYQLICDKRNFSSGDCGTFHLNAGFFVIKKRKICATINIGCGYNQWNFSPENSHSMSGALNRKGFKKMEILLDNINLNIK